MKDNFSESSIKIGNQNEFKEGNVVGNHNNVIINKQNNSSVSYEGDKDNVYFLNRISPIIIHKYGERKLKILSALTFISSIITIGLWINSFSTTKVIPLVPRITVIEPEWLFYTGILLIVLFIFSLNIVSHYANTKCKNCKKEFAYDECQDPLVEEIKTLKGTRKTTIRYYECKFCGDTHQVKTKQFIPKETKS